jgi:hypothetical protein
MGKNRSASGITNVIQYDNNGNIAFVSGSTTLMQVSSSGAITTTGVISGSNALSASFSLNSALLNDTGSVGFATTASLLTVSSSQQQISSSLLQVSASYISLSGSYNTFSGSNSEILTAVSSSQQQISSSLLNVISVFATTGSNSFRATQSITGSLTVTGQIIAQTLNVQQVTSSIIYSSGSNNFGCDLNSRQVFTGSFYQTGSIAVFNSCVGIGTSSPTRLLDVSNTSGDSTIVITSADATGQSSLFYGKPSDANIGGVLYNHCNNQMSFRVNDTTKMSIASTGDVGIGTCTPSYKLDVRNASGTGAQTIVSVVNKTNDSNTGAFIGFGDAYTDTVSPYLFAARVGGTRDGSGDGGFMSFYTRPTSAFEYERMRITAGGIACFACQVCAKSLYFSSNSTGQITFGSNDACNPYIVSDSSNILYLGNNNSYKILIPQDGSDMVFRTSPTYANPQTRLTITAAGIACFACTVCAYSFASPTPSLTRNNLNIDRATKVITSFNATASGARWLRVGCFNARTTYLMSFGTTGNYYTPGSTTFLMFRDWGNGFFTSTLGKLGEQYVTCARFQSDNVGDTYALEVWMNSITADQLNNILVYSAATLAGNPDSTLMCLGSYGTSLANASQTSTAISL